MKFEIRIFKHGATGHGTRNKGIPPQDRNDGTRHPERVITSRRIPLEW
jgi:hypothetical protein